MGLWYRRRHKRPAATVHPEHQDDAPATFLALSSDAIWMFLVALRESTDVFPPLKSAVGAVLAVWDLADRISAYDKHAQALAWRAASILYAMNSATRARSAGPISQGMLDAVLQFEGILCEICAAMEHEAQLKLGPLRRVLGLQRRESRLVRFSAQLDAASDAFKIGCAARVEVAVAKIQADVAIIATSRDASSLALQLEQSNTRLRGEVRVLRIVVLFGVSPVSHGYHCSCACAL
ncbi:hypothetical protein B0H12DRAFT_159313 [Mycena haematopus]|nr:hypothetical protein B0H12DRAFT_159313 [Mycena haematopus]